MQTQQSNLQRNQAQPAQPAPPTPFTRTPQPWVKPTFEQVRLNDAQANSGSGVDGGSTYNSHS